MATGLRCEAISRLEATGLRFEAIASRLMPLLLGWRIALRFEAFGLWFEAIASRVDVTGLTGHR